MNREEHEPYIGRPSKIERKGSSMNNHEEATSPTDDTTEATYITAARTAYEAAALAYIAARTAFEDADDAYDTATDAYNTAYDFYDATRSRATKNQMDLSLAHPQSSPQRKDI